MTTGVFQKGAPRTEKCPVNYIARVCPELRAVFDVTVDRT